MACGGEANPSFAQIAARAAELCAVAETHAPDPAALAYVIGTEVPVPGGETEEPDALDVTSVDRLHETLRTHRDAWAARDLTAAWGRIVAVVTQPGVDFGHTSVYPFVPEKAAPLGEAILEEDGLAFEAHSTDYQPDAALADLVRGHFFFLKVGPELTFRFREAVLALGTIEEVLALPDPSRIAAVLDDRMLAVPNHWQAYYRGTQDEQRLLRTYGYSDRIRYYWTDPFVAAALEKLLANLSAQPLSETLVSQAFMALDFDAIPHTPEALINLHVQRCIDRYRIACGQ